ncbi:MAG: RNA polymerase sigma factor [Patescibacteria group bacterium]|nr:RNA polymerase sigma factor [Patescibacteria group bacterium]
MNLSIIEKFKENSIKDRLKNRDQSAFEDLYNKNIDDIYRFIYFKIGKKDDASDLSSLVFLKTWEHIQKNSISNKETLRGLVYKIARHVVIDYYRSNKGENLSLDDENNKIDVVDEKYDIESEMSSQADFGDLMSQMMELKNEYREILLMRFVNELSLDEISDITGKKKINVRVLLHRAVKALKEIVEKEN